MIYKNLFLIAIGFIIGAFAGGSVTYFTVKDQFGDKYEIVKPKIKGDNSTLDVIQDNYKEDNRTKRRKRKGKL